MEYKPTTEVTAAIFAVRDIVHDFRDMLFAVLGFVDSIIPEDCQR